ncbi:hypothetical protein TNCV_2687751 [Trichonephila clavipes]|nr:hypothetical protein TNCV_2687751 [Trichonephila clavipes]
MPAQSRNIVFCSADLFHGLLRAPERRIAVGCEVSSLSHIHRVDGHKDTVAKTAPDIVCIIRREQAVNNPRPQTQCSQMRWGALAYCRMTQGGLQPSHHSEHDLTLAEIDASRIPL